MLRVERLYLVFRSIVIAHKILHRPPAMSGLDPYEFRAIKHSHYSRFVLCPLS